ncbi:MAG TPA: hypothetical protein VHR88_00570 [Solirubrobacteraceae bacterium]|jgi:hypothetical protein|nr:hypothetical protein [Solirubrobacteraceae bacterium]
MVREGGLILLLTGVHALGLGLLCGMLWLSFKADDRASGDDDGDGGWGNDRRPPEDSHGPRDGGLPLPDAEQSKVRLREPGRLSERLPKPERRPTKEPERVPVER